jgi:hypothetical protein
MQPSSPPLEAVRSLVGDAAATMARSGGAPSGLWEEAAAFAHAVTWHEPFIVALLALHLATFCAAVLLRGRALPLMALLGGALALTSSGARLNALGAAHWNAFASQDYFDRRGVFFALLVAGPQILVALFIVVSTRACACLSASARARVCRCVAASP